MWSWNFKSNFIYIFGEIPLISDPYSILFLTFTYILYYYFLPTDQLKPSVRQWIYKLNFVGMGKRLAFITNYLKQQKVQKRYVLVVVSIALFVEQMLYMASKCFIILYPINTVKTVKNLTGHCAHYSEVPSWNPCE